MSIFELFSKRREKLTSKTQDVYQYSKIPNNFRVQVIHIVRDTIGIEDQYNHVSSKIYLEIHQTLCKEYGVFALRRDARTNFEAIFDFFLETNKTEQCLDIIDLVFNVIDHGIRNNSWEFSRTRGVTQTPDAAIEELNYRFKEASIGYQFISGELIRIDSQYIHSETVKPVLQLLGKEKCYSGANHEFLSAHEHYRNKKYKECLNDCLKSFESLMKAIHDKHGWQYNKNDTSKKLINSCFNNGLVPEYLQNQFSSVRTLLESGVPTLRNKEGGHGQGVVVKNVPEHFASYTLHLTATTLLFLLTCEENHT
ncbi:STM4504/CBY_0614 family protein [Pseudoalteromonas luteoviolacea]|uniref:Abortive infection protein-like C-terminal domain-containing protein n=1 Tax=Pseudoalteromonas luteoviolacea S4054 TaxID=1129367 RepID=A0A0F6AEF1_9GAMM|nr:hypothetical protein [Pseudoalteromonas luteoviolacea]AOT08259.1 hypothetical protein S4054249_10585 [Pseudoalteromonas luteoviolacea]AOT13175.1 hypothetical protein S40542_10560 [Pseudoalteromonas luteoviolacea]AOT18087.1 hypothetical protein S4054_10555 [Pseudoalteromonas luteoviolacea]KKE84191.1 hypothetical protein N479_09845 [Pseudoalteromonas luteoviolacea S4054]KZN76204.1 hypothetical protein N481_07570 [Pseudoalteromonas luteoviolacea S4047-1]